jgi:Tfp pilus assembly protein FimT
MAMIDMIFLELGIAFVIVATLAAVATTSASQTVRGFASKTVNGSLTAALISAALTAWFIFWPPI